jgi:ribosomal protein L27
MGSDYTIFATAEGSVEFKAKGRGRKYVSVVAK